MEVFCDLKLTLFLGYSSKLNRPVLFNDFLVFAIISDSNQNDKNTSTATINYNFGLVDIDPIFKVTALVY